MTKMSAFFFTPVKSVNPGKKLNLGAKNLLLRPRETNFVTLKTLPNIDKLCDQDIRSGLPNIGIFRPFWGG